MAVLGRRRLLVGGAVLAVLVVVAVALVVVLRDDAGDDTRLARAVAMAPKSTQRYSWTDWAAVRDDLGSDIPTDASAGDLRRFLDEAYSADLTSTSAIVSAAEPLQAELGLSPATVSWELFTQGAEGALLLLGVPDGFDPDDLESRLEGLGYDAPTGDDSIWTGDLAQLQPRGITPEFSYVSIDTEAGVVAASDGADYLLDRDDAARGDSDDGVADAVAAMGEPLAASVLAGDNACADLAMTQADGPDRVRAEQLIDEAGEVGPYRGFAMGLMPDGELRVALGFETEDQARTNADSRAELLAGPAPGQGGSFPDRFSVERIEADGTVVTMRLDPVEGTFPLSDLSTGPVLFATC
ncbi:hypothetical protein HNR19_003615 [Nocardioides thalensis]|uniref:DUF3352 domain-containing protein n=1 Tax=Nocardioides thalensis TaxID=1914755 RepID=A0A853C6M1_9ACTN|nr:hypothetical protein [Nocardioides thalensis]NYJ02917.1 hypothetical protein [Nocardioides thalensis]